MDAALGRKTRRNRGAVSLACLCIAVWMLGAEPASQPSSEPQIRTWFNQLADSDAAVREKAVQSLMGLASNDLPKLQKIIEQAGPLRPSQKIVLHDIVTQVYLADLPYTPSDQPFLGISWKPPDPFVIVPDAPAVAPNSDPGIVVASRVVGFHAFRVLREGDVVLAVQVDPEHELSVTATNFPSLIGTFPIGQFVPLRVMRDGREFIARILLRSRPADLVGPNPPLDAWLNERLHTAEEYWAAHFARLVGEELS